MQLSLNIKNEQILDKLLWVLEHFKSDGVEIINPNNTTDTKSVTYQKLEELNAKIGGNELLQFKLKHLSKQYVHSTVQTDDELLYDALKEKYGA
ncbi:MAG: hypothetical protein IE878_06355 [Epsilonproteobacteria bacterium]|nr:hypothetical protein [Campylobacterota bacterium]MBD3839988.1 hypothetical protein [Campylobacterota bacterium]